MPRRFHGEHRDVRLKWRHRPERWGKERSLLDFVVVSTDGIADFWFLLIFFGKFHAEKCVGQFGLFIRHFAYVVEQTCATCFLRVETKLRKP